MDEQRLRLSDAERERAATELGGHYAEGRLTAEEHAERLDRIWAARTRGELRPMFTDLPGSSPAGPAGPVRPATAAPARVRRRPGPPPRGFPLLPAVVALVLLAALTPVPWLVGLVVLPLVAFVVTRRTHWSRCAR